MIVVADTGPIHYLILSGHIGLVHDLYGAVLLPPAVHRELLHEGHATRLEGVFHVEAGPAMRDWCSARGLDAAAPLVIRREIQGGRSRGWVGGQAVQQKELRELAALLADFHGQRDLAQLLERERHADLLDTLPSIAPARTVHDAAWLEWRGAAGALAEARRARERQRELRELWQFQAEELDKLAARPGEDRALETEHRVLSNAEELQRVGHQAAEALYEGEDALHARLVAVHKELAQAARLDAAFAEPAGLLAEALLQLEEASRLARSRAEALESDPERLEMIRERLGQLDRMIRKHGGSLDLLLERQQELGRLLAEGDDLDSRIAGLERGEEEPLRCCQTSTACPKSCSASCRRLRISK